MWDGSIYRKVSLGTLAFHLAHTALFTPCVGLPYYSEYLCSEEEGQNVLCYLLDSA